jgi:hypothetical protein
MPKPALGLIVSLILLPVFAFAQTNTQNNPKPPAAWIAFQQQENVKRQVFFKQMKDDRDAFLAANPDAKAYFDQMRAAGQARLAAWRTAHPRKTPYAPPPTNPATAH